MADVIDILSSDEEEKNEAGFISPSVTLEPVRKKRKLQNGDVNVIVLTDEEDCTTNASNKNSTEPTITTTVDLEVEDNSNNSSKENVSIENTPMTTNGATVTNGCDYTIPKELEEFIATCKAKISDRSTLKMLTDKVPILVKTCRRADEYTKSETFKSRMMASIENVKSGRGNIAFEFHEVYNDMRSNYDRSDRDNKTLKKLHMLLEKLIARTRKLEFADVDFDDEDDSTYIKMQRYRERTALVYSKIKEIEGADPHLGSVYYSRLDFCNASHPEINKAINKKFSDRTKIPFPTILDVDKCIRKCAKQHNLKFSEGQLLIEIRSCFEKLGDLIQRKRRQDLAYVHYTFLENVNAPDAPEIEEKLKQNKRESNESTDRIMTKYTLMQETGENPDLSTDSDDSNYPESDEENGA